VETWNIRLRRYSWGIFRIGNVSEGSFMGLPQIDNSVLTFAKHDSVPRMIPVPIIAQAFSVVMMWFRVVLFGGNPSSHPVKSRLVVEGKTLIVNVRMNIMLRNVVGMDIITVVVSGYHVPRQMIPTAASVYTSSISLTHLVLPETISLIGLW